MKGDGIFLIKAVQLVFSDVNTCRGGDSCNSSGVGTAIHGQTLFFSGHGRLSTQQHPIFGKQLHL